MLRLTKSLQNIPVLSLRTGGRVATAERVILNPNNLKIEGWYCIDSFSNQTLILLNQDVREFVPQGIAIDDHSVLAEPEDLVRLEKIMNIGFELVGKAVITDKKRRLGKVEDYATDEQSFFVKKLYVNPPIHKALTGSQLSIDRTQVIEITDKKITVKDVDVKVQSGITQPAFGV